MVVLRFNSVLWSCSSGKATQWIL